MPFCDMHGIVLEFLDCGVVLNADCKALEFAASRMDFDPSPQ
jgi:hypothetical protein